MSNSARDAVAAAVSGGMGNVARAPYASVAGGISNDAAGYGAAVAGGQDNAALGMNSFVGGGSYNTASGDLSFAVGKFAAATDDQSAVFSFGDGTSCESQGENSVHFCVPGGLYINGVELSDIATDQCCTFEVWHCLHGQLPFPWSLAEKKKKNAVRTMLHCR